MVVDCWLLTRTLAPKKRACDMLRHICLHHQNSITGSCKAFALQHFGVSESTTFIGFFEWNLSRQMLSYFLNNHAIIKSKHVIFMILIALTDVTNYESWIPEVNAFRRLSIPPSKVLGTARLSYAVGARLFTHIWCAWTPWCEFIWVGQGLPEPCSNKTGYGEVNAVVKLDHIFDHKLLQQSNRRTWWSLFGTFIWEPFSEGLWVDTAIPHQPPWPLPGFQSLDLLDGWN